MRTSTWCPFLGTIVWLSMPLLLFYRLLNSDEPNSSDILLLILDYSWAFYFLFIIVPPDCFIPLLSIYVFNFLISYIIRHTMSNKYGSTGWIWLVININRKILMCYFYSIGK